MAQQRSSSRRPRAPHRLAWLRALGAPLLAAPALFGAATASAAVQFTVTDLGTLGGTFSIANGINAAGQVVGLTATAGDATQRAFLWQAGSLRDLGTLGGTDSGAAGINAAGQVVGGAEPAAGAYSHGFVWQSGAMQDLGTLGGNGSMARGVNAAGQVVGYADTRTGARHAFRWQSGAMQDLGTLDGGDSYGIGINAAGQVVGYAYTNAGGSIVNHAFLWQAGTMYDLGTLGGGYSAANAINDAGQVVGDSSLNASTSHAFLWQGGGMQDLGTLGGSYSSASGINAAGQVVGVSSNADNRQHGFIGTAQTGLMDLNQLLVSGSGATISSAAGINDAGQIAATATMASGQRHAVMLTPTGSVAWTKGGAGGSFADGANWEQGFAPSPFLDAVIAPVGRQTIQMSNDATVKSLSLGGSTGASGRPELQLQYGAQLTAAGGVTVQATGTLGGDGTIRGNLLNRGTLRPDNLSVTGSLSNAGVIAGDGTLNANLDNAAAGLVRSGAGQALHVVGATHHNAGSVEVSNGGVLAFSGALDNANGGRIFLKSGVLRLDGGATNAGQINVTFGTSDVHGAVTTVSGGRVTLSGNSDTTFYDTVDVKSGGELRVSAGSAAVFFGQVLQRTGALFSGTGSKFYEGGLSVGASPGLGVDSGDVTFGSSNVYLAEIGGLAAGTGFDKYEVAGKLGFGGVLKVVWWNGFTGQAGQRFDLFDWGAHDGSFSQVDLSGAPLAAGLTWDTSKLYASGELSISPVPEAATWAMLLPGLFLVGLVVRRRAHAESGRAGTA